MSTLYLLAGNLVLLLVSNAVSFFIGMKKGIEKSDLKYLKLQEQRAESDREFAHKSDKIQKEVFENAEQQKSEIASKSGVDKFNAITDKLRNTAKN
jgi:hypothetical protein